MHVLPQLRRLESKFRQELAVIGVHTAKFDAERATANIHQAVRRYRVGHPVVNDAQFQVWQSYAVRAWPTLMFIDPAGYVIGKHEGEFDSAALEQVLGKMVDQFRTGGLLKPADLLSTADDGDTGMLRFPGKVLADDRSGRLFISDSNNDRIIVCGFDGKVESVIGGNGPGMADGPAGRAQFNQPQGTALSGDTLFVADTGNHALRQVDLGSGNVTTLAGPAEGLRSPWDLALHDGALMVAMAGSHQIWRVDLATGGARPYAGSGREGINDGPLASAWLAQPSGLAALDGSLYVADSETSAIRRVTGGEVQTVVGLGLFEFGDVDGEGADVRLQHPIGISAGSECLYVADSYNHKLKMVWPDRKAAVTLAGDGSPGLADGPFESARFSEPAGLSLGGGRLWVADTNNHALRVLDLERRTVATLQIAGL